MLTSLIGKALNICENLKHLHGRKEGEHTVLRCVPSGQSLELVASIGADLRLPNVAKVRHDGITNWDAVGTFRVVIM